MLDNRCDFEDVDTVTKSIVFNILIDYVKLFKNSVK